jgi:hypothetical protein
MKWIASQRAHVLPVSLSLSGEAGLAATCRLGRLSSTVLYLLSCHVSSLIYHPAHSIRRMYTES